ncbi:citramalate synthase [Lentzea flava]|uniref:Citramalate synthase n=1 Tax=Lentzea flava TaxID=103732 RepID=A0ABQ2V8K5_9PSEU|nr:citramalate synthase [Lentzea flava]MCP2203872.1 2-isopropylmalate synthase (EC 2.3.3.13) [Lentzea flava]GGU72412.1 (R)-citramalate synthase [Lentzea flava]
MFQLYDTTLRDGVQGEGLALTVADKLAIARHLDAFGVTFIEGGWPGAIPKDTEFFRRAHTELTLRNAELAAFGSTRRPDTAVTTDPQVTALLAAQTPVVTIVAKSHVRHVELALRTTLAQNVAMIRDTVRHLVREGRRVFLDAEHFFEGYLADPFYATEIVRAAAEAGAEAVVLCDTNGGMLPDQVGAIVTAVGETGARLGVHCHDDSGCAVANTLAAVDAGVDHVQVTAHGIGERCGNANLFTVAANLVLKKGIPVVSEDQLATMAGTAQRITAITGVPANRAAPYVGASAFAHKAGLHASALRVDSTLYQHIQPDAVGNARRTLVSDMAGRASIELKAHELGYALTAGSDVAARVTERVKTLENHGYAFESADASFELLLREELREGVSARPFDIDSWHVTVRRPKPGGAVLTVAEVTVRVGDVVRSASGEGNGAITALDRALRAALLEFFPGLLGLELVGHRVRVVEESADGDPVVRVLASFHDGSRRWKTVGVEANVIGASLRALVDAHQYAVLRGGLDPADSVSGRTRRSQIGADHVRT